MDQDTHDEAAAQETEGGSSTAGPRPLRAVRTLGAPAWPFSDAMR